MSKSGTLSVRIVGDTAPFSKSMKGLSGSVGKSAGKIAKVGAVAFAAVGAAAATAVFKIAAFGDEIAKSAGKAGVGVEQFQELRFAFGQGGVEAKTMDTALLKFNKRLGESATGVGTADEAFASLGVSLRDADGNVRDAGGAMDEVLPKLAAIESDAERAALAGDLFGQRAGPELAAALSDGIGGIDEARQKAQDLGIVMSGEAAEAAEKFTDQFDDIKQSALGFARDALTPLMVLMSEKVFPAIQNGLGTLRDLKTEFDNAGGGAEGLGAVFANVFDGEGGGLFSGILDAARSAIGSVIEWLTDGGFEQIFTFIMESRQRLFDAALVLFPALLDAIVEFVPELLTWITGTMIPQILDLIVTAVPDLLDAAITMFNALVDAVVEVLPDLLDTLLGDVLPALLETVLGMIPELLETAVEVFTSLVDAVVEVLPDLVETLLVDVLPGLIETLLDMVPDLLLAAVDMFLALVDAILEVLPELIDTLIGDVLPSLLETLIGMIPELVLTAIEVFLALVTGILKALPDIIGVIVTDLIPAILEAVIKVIPDLLIAGVDMVKGIWEGIKSMGSWLKDKVVGWAADVLPGPIADLLGISSPSKLFAEMGRDVGRGLADGIDGSRRWVERASADLAAAAQGDASATLVATLASGGMGRQGGTQGGTQGNTYNVSVPLTQTKMTPDELRRTMRQIELVHG